MTTPEEQPQQVDEEQPEELKEYHYYIGFIEHTGLLTEEMAERLGAKPIGEELDDPSLQTNAEQRGNVISSRDVRGEQRGARARSPKNKQA